MNERFPKHVRVRKQADFDAVYRASTYAADSVLVMQAHTNNLNVTRLGMSVSKKVGDAPTRNKWKRKIREVFRKHRDSLPAGMDLVIRPRKGAKIDYAAIEKSLPRLAQRVARKLTLRTQA